MFLKGFHRARPQIQRNAKNSHPQDAAMSPLLSTDVRAPQQHMLQYHKKLPWLELNMLFHHCAQSQWFCFGPRRGTYSSTPVNYVCQEADDVMLFLDHRPYIIELYLLYHVCICSSTAVKSSGCYVTVLSCFSYLERTDLCENGLLKIPYLLNDVSLLLYWATI